jgi:MFS family permease
MDGLPAEQRQKRIAIGFLNWAHAIDHYVILIFATVVIELQAVEGRTYADLIWLGTGLFIAFGVFSLPAGWLADRWSRRYMMAAFYFGCGVTMAAAALAPSMTMLAVAMFALGIFAAIYHPVGMAMLIEISQARGRTLAFNGVCGNLGAALAAGVTGGLVSWLGWRGAFIVPAVICIASGFAFLAYVSDDRHQTGSRKSVAEISMSTRVAIAIFGLYVVISLTSGLVFNSISVALPKIVDERIGQNMSLSAVGWMTTGVFLCGAVAQLIMGRLVERFSPPLLFGGIVTLQFFGILWAANASGPMLVVALALTMATIYGQVTAGDIVIARYTADAWRGRVYAVRYFLTFTTSAAAVSAIAVLHARGGFDMVLAAIAVVAALLVISVQAFVVLAIGAARTQSRAVQPAE